MTTPSDPREAAREAAREAGLRYSTDDRAGLRRIRAGKGFRYLDPDGRAVRDRETLDRIRTLAVPPAWTDVWICPSPNGHLQATGRDARGRKQYRYHARYRADRENAKFARLLVFAGALPRIRTRVARDLERRGLPREKVLAAVVALLERTLVRVGNEEYARLNRSFGLTTLRDRHARVEGTRVRFRFRGKSGRLHEVGLRDRRLASVIRRCQELPGQDLFQYLDADDELVSIGSEDVNDYLRDAARADVTAKDFRTWAGTVLAYRALRAMTGPPTADGSRRAMVAAVRDTARHLGNTAAVCRRSYIHPAVLDAYVDGRIRGALVEAAEEQLEPPQPTTPTEERAVAAILRQATADRRRKRRRPRTGAPRGVQAASR